MSRDISAERFSQELQDKEGDYFRRLNSIDVWVKVRRERPCSGTAGQFGAPGWTIASSDNKYILLNRESKCYAKYGYLFNFVVIMSPTVHSYVSHVET